MSSSDDTETSTRNSPPKNGQNLRKKVSNENEHDSAVEER